MSNSSTTTQKRLNFVTIFFGISAILLGGCASAPQKSIEQQISDHYPPTISALSGKSVAINIEFMQRINKSENISNKSQDNSYDIAPVIITQDKDMKSGLIFEDARIQLKTNEQLDFFQKYIYETVSRSGGLALPAGQNADMLLSAKLTFGPVPAPAYRDHNLGKSLGISMLTLGLGPSSWSAIVDYKIDIHIQDNKRNSVVEYSEIVRKNDEELKSYFNFDRIKEVQQIAIEAFRITLQQQIQAVAQKINKTCKNDC